MNLAYPLADALLLGLVVAVLAITGWRLDRAWLCILGGTAALALADSGVLYQAAVGSTDSIALLDAGWPLAMLLLAAASWQPAGRLGAVRPEGARVLALPAVFGLTSLAILVYGQFEPLNTPAVVLAATSMLAVVARMAYTFREKMQLLAKTRIEAETDALTGVGNPRKLMIDLGATLDARTTSVLMLLDLDGFKAYNDTFGHPAGDALLARIAEKLSGAVAGDGEVYRIGGDEFCVLAGVGPERRDAFAAATAMSLEEQGPGFKITAAYGTVTLPEEADGVADALRIVDGRMYDEKDGRRASAGRQSRDVLLRVLYERDARLQGHLSGIVELVRAVGVNLGLTGRAADVALAAELHEVGKLAIPDSILRKPGPLNDEEWSFVRRHPLIGERILSSAPALAKVSRLVRSTQERVDGMGYPDRLMEDDIPLGSRIICVCAAFVAMTSNCPIARHAPPRKPSPSFAAAPQPVRRERRRGARRGSHRGRARPRRRRLAGHDDALHQVVSRHAAALVPSGVEVTGQRTLCLGFGALVQGSLDGLERRAAGLQQGIAGAEQHSRPTLVAIGEGDSGQGLERVGQTLPVAELVREHQALLQRHGRLPGCVGEHVGEPDVEQRRRDRVAPADDACKLERLVEQGRRATVRFREQLQGAKAAQGGHQSPVVFCLPCRRHALREQGPCAFVLAQLDGEIGELRERVNDAALTPDLPTERELPLDERSLALVAPARCAKVEDSWSALTRRASGSSVS